MSGEAVVMLADGQEAYWRVAVAGAGVSAAFDAWKPFEALPEELVGAVMLQASHDRRHSTLLAPGRVWKTHVVSDRQPDQVAIAFGERSRAGAGLDLEDLGRRRGDRPADRAGSVRRRPSDPPVSERARRRDPDRCGRFVLDRGPRLAERSGGTTSPGLAGRSGAGHGLLVRPRRWDRKAGVPGSR